jgi:glycine/D-amino acid oxidase-like deaminating enzyme
MGQWSEYLPYAADYSGDTHMARLTRRGALKAAGAAALGAAGVPAFAIDRPRHVAVIGAGAFGGWAALQLVRSGVRVTLLDTWGPGNSRASSGGESRVIRGIYGEDEIYTRLVHDSYPLWRQLEKSCDEPLLRMHGLLWMFSVDDGYARKALPIQAKYGMAVDSISVAEAKRRYPQIDFAGVRTVYLEHEAGSLSARRACQVVCRQFQRDGGSYRQEAAMPGTRRNGRLSGLTLADGSLLGADAYLFACGPWLGRIFPELLGKKVTATRQEVFFFGTPDQDRSFDEGRLPMWVDFGERLVYGIPGSDRRGFKVADDTRGPSFDPTDGDRTPSADGLERARTFLARRFPRLAHAPLLEARVCQYENSTDGHLILDRHPEMENVWILGGGSGHGFKLSPALGALAARQIFEGGAIEPKFSIKRLESAKQGTQFKRRQ